MKSKTPRKRLWVGMAVALLLFILLVVPRLLPQGYNRYVSPPLSDGTRYTFLYPRIRRHTYDTGGNDPMSLRLCTHSTSSFLDLIFDRLRGREEMDGHLYPEEIEVEVTSLKNALPQSRRTEKRYDFSSYFRHHEVILEDARSGRQYLMRHSCNMADTHIFEATDPVVTASFQILPPGVSPP